MKISITRSFSRTKQIAAFEPINAMCSATIEEDGLPDMDKLDDEEKKLFIGLQREMSEGLDSLVRQEVEKTIDAELAKRKSPDPHKIQDSAKAEAEHDAGQSTLDRLIDQEAQGKAQRGYKEI